MKPYLAIWWRFHRGLIDPEIAAALTSEQVQGMYLDTLYEERMIPIWKRPHWYIGAACMVLLGLAIWGRFAMAGAVLGRWLGGCGVFVIMYVLAALCAGCTWWFLRRAHARSIYRTVRLYGFDVCLECGYWLRGLDDDLRKCPECGTNRLPKPREAA